MAEKGKRRSKLFLILFLLTSVACQALFPKSIVPGSLSEQIAEGNIRLNGNGNVTYIGCQDPTAVVSIDIGKKTKEIEGIAYYDYVNPVTINTVTNGTQIRIEECQKSNESEKYNWPAKGIYYPQEERIIFTTCTQNNDKAVGEANLVGEGFVGEYACYDEDGQVIYEVAISAYEIDK